MPGIDHRNTTLKAYTLESALLKGRACKTGTVTGAVTAITGAADVVKGFAIDDGAIGENRAIAEDGGHIMVEAGAAFSADVDLMIDAVGRVVLWAGGAGTNVLRVGKALEAATAAGDYVPMLLAVTTKQG
jgi:hypothetical protein